jgi:2-dehydro-3-deoxygluconokinase
MALAAKEDCDAPQVNTNLHLWLWPLDRARAVINAVRGLAGIALPGLDNARDVTGRQHRDAICDFCFGLGCRIVGLTMGAEGTPVATAAHRKRVPARQVKPVDATAAGDTFDDAFPAEYLRTDDSFRAAAYATPAAALSMQGCGAAAPMPRRSEAEAFMGRTA